MGKKSTASGDKIVQIDESQIHSHLDRVVRGTVEETINNLLDAEAEQLCKAGRYERSDKRQDYRAGHYSRKLHTKAGEVEVKMPKLRKLPFETAIIERHRRLDPRIRDAAHPGPARGWQDTYRRRPGREGHRAGLLGPVLPLR